jgi:hypothetical protein
LSKNITLPAGRVVFEDIRNPRETDNGDQFGVTIYYSAKTDNAAFKEVKAAIVTALAAKNWKPDTRNVKNPFKRAGDACVYGRDHERAGECYDFVEDEDNIVIKAVTRFEPGLFSQVGGSTRVVSRDEFYSGCYAFAQVSTGTYDVEGNFGVTLYLNSLVKVGDGESLGGGAVTVADVEVAAPATLCNIPDQAALAESVEGDIPF